MIRHLVRLFAVIAIAVMAFVPATAAFADEAANNPGWYAGMSAGVVLPAGVSTQGTTFTDGVNSTTLWQGWKPQSGLNLGVQGGYDFNGPRVEGEFLYQSYGRPSTVATATVAGVTGSRSTGNGGIQNYTFMLNGLYDFHNKSAVTPYLGGGIGFSSVTARGTNSVYSVGVGTASFATNGISATVFAYQAKAGLAYNVNPATALFLQYRYLGSSNFNYGGATLSNGGKTFTIAPASGHLSNSSFDLGVRFKL